MPDFDALIETIGEQAERIAFLEEIIAGSYESFLRYQEVVPEVERNNKHFADFMKKGGKA